MEAKADEKAVILAKAKELIDEPVKVPHVYTDLPKDEEEDRDEVLEKVMADLQAYN